MGRQLAGEKLDTQFFEVGCAAATRQPHCRYCRPALEYVRLIIRGQCRSSFRCRSLASLALRSRAAAAGERHNNRSIFERLRSLHFPSRRDVETRGLGTAVVRGSRSAVGGLHRCCSELEPQAVCAANFKNERRRTNVFSRISVKPTEQFFAVHCSS